ncbi:hypothetical protein BMT55_08145 [Listeria newyorkensis]|uniref:Lipoprotein n=1 Tax=Listeria newyorkensis TaxID=1497681 RepID=A0ABX4XND8_9LIST|nr:hypothetical protein [Listeria newyorkensis]PNP92530.1 hypothetical protein BMT55_08145 [Listeria newyorkensis]
MKKVFMGIGLILMVVLVGCTPEQKINETGVNQTMNNKDLIVEWAPIYTAGGKQIIDVNSQEYQDILVATKIIMLSNINSDGKVTLTTNGAGYIKDDESGSTFYLLTLLTNRTDKHITSIHYDIQVVLNASGEILTEASFDISDDVYGKSIDPNTGYMALLPFSRAPEKTAGTRYDKNEITVQTNVTYDTVEN